MKNFLGNGVITVILSFCATCVTLQWLSNDEPDKSLFKPSMFRAAEEDIDRVELEYVKDQINLKVFLKNQISCRQVIDVLGIKSFEVKDTTYIPTCSVIDDSFIKVTYIRS